MSVRKLPTSRLSACAQPASSLRALVGNRVTGFRVSDDREGGRSRTKHAAYERRSSGPIGTTGKCCFLIYCSPTPGITDTNAPTLFYSPNNSTTIYPLRFYHVNHSQAHAFIRMKTRCGWCACVRISDTRVHGPIIDVSLDVSACNLTVFRFISFSRTHSTRGFPVCFPKRLGTRSARRRRSQALRARIGAAKEKEQSNGERSGDERCSNRKDRNRGVLQRGKKNAPFRLGKALRPAPDRSVCVDHDRNGKSEKNDGQKQKT